MGKEGKGAEGDGEGFAGPMSDSFLRACISPSIDRVTDRQTDSPAADDARISRSNVGGDVIVA